MSDGIDGGGAPEHGTASPGFRLPDGTRLGRVRLQVADLERSLAYYEMLGFRVLERSPAHASLGSLDTALVELHEREGARPAPAGGHPGLYHYAILLPDRTSLGRFAAHMTDLEVRFGAADHRVSEALYLRDPDGLGIEVYADRPRSAWRHEAGQLVMTTDPLDPRSVLDAAAGEPWTGMPTGTVLGHIHLHVGDLAPAEAFYHRALGLDKTVWSYPGALFLSAGGYHHHLGLNTWAAGASPAGDGDARLLEWELSMPEQAAAGALESLAAAGHASDRSADGGVVRDPWGTALRVRSVD